MAIRGENIGTAYVKIIADGDGIRGTIERGFEDSEPAFRKGGEDGADAYQEGFLKRFRRNIGNAARLLAPDLSKFNNELDRTADRVGAALGRGSRNDFLNVIGSMVRGALRLLFVVPKALQSIIDFGKGIGTSFTEGGGGGMLAAIGPAAVSAAAGLAAIGVAVVGLAVVLGPIISLFSMLLGILTALASTITFGLIGALAPLVGLLAPVAAGIATIGVAFVGMSDKFKKGLGESVKPLGDGLKELGAIAREGIFANIDTQVGHFASALSSLKPLVKGVSDALGDAFTGWADDLDSPGFRDWVRAMSQVLPGMLRDLGDILSNTFGGLGGVFRALMPITQQFLTWIEGITQQFQDWANSAKGRAQLEEFFRRAGESAKALGGFIGEVVGLIADLFDAGKSTGDTIFDDMTEGIKNFRKWLDKGGGENLEKWFQDAEDTAGAIGEMVVGISKFFDALDTPENRRFVIFLLETLGAIGGLLAGWFNLIDKAIIQPIKTAWGEAQKLKQALEGFDFPDLGAMFSGIGGGIGSAGSAIGGAFSGIVSGAVDAAQGVINAFISLPFQLVAIFTSIPGLIATGLERLPGLANRAVNGVVGFFRQMPGRIGGMLRTLGSSLSKIFAPIAAAAARTVSNVVGFFRSLPGRIQAFLASIPGRAQGVLSRIGQIAGTVVSNVVSFFRGLPGRLASAIASIPGRFQSLIGRLPPEAQKAIEKIANNFRNLPANIGRILSALGGIAQRAFDNMVSAASSVAGRIVGAFAGLGQRILNAIGSIDIGKLIHVPDPGGGVPFVPGIRVAAGGAVDPFAAGAGVRTPSGRAVNVGGITVISPSADPRAVAVETVNHLVAVGY